MTLSIGTPRPCKGCGGTIFKSKFCSNPCREAWRAEQWKGAKSKAEVSAEAKERNTKTCAVCDRQFIRRSSGRDAGMCCSRICGFKLIGRRAEQRRNIRAATADFVKWARQAAKAPKPKKLGKACRLCGVSVRKHAQLCDECRQCEKRKRIVEMRDTEAYRRIRRVAKARRRALERGIEAERFDPLEILNRDKWRCHMCGCSTPKRLRGSFDDRAPELDHIVPLAAGGQHTRLNTACACRRCNREKGSEVKGQLRLVA